MTVVLKIPAEMKKHHHCFKIYILHQKVNVRKHNRAAFCAAFFPWLCPLMRCNLWKIRRGSEEANYRKTEKSEIPSPPSPRGDQSISCLIYLGWWDSGEFHSASALSADNYHSPLLSICRCQNRYCANRSFRNSGRQTGRIWHYLSAVSCFKTHKV